MRLAHEAFVGVAVAGSLITAAACANLGNTGHVRSAAACFADLAVRIRDEGGAVGDQAQALVDHAKWLSRNGEFEEATAALREAQSLAPSADTSNALGLALLEQGRVNGALNAFKDAAARFPDSAELRFNMANAYTRKKDFEGAAAQLREAVRLAPEDSRVMPMTSLSRTLVYAGGDAALAEAVQVAEGAVAIAEGAAEQAMAHIAHARALHAADPAGGAALAAWDRAVEAEPRYAGNRRFICDVLVRQDGAAGEDCVQFFKGDAPEVAEWQARVDAEVPQKGTETAETEL